LCRQLPMAKGEQQKPNTRANHDSKIDSKTEKIIQEYNRFSRSYPHRSGEKRDKMCHTRWMMCYSTWSNRAFQTSPSALRT
jgi:hypothetical protein